MNRGGYEFNERENEIFLRLVRNMSRSGLVAVIASLILLAYHLVDYFGLSLGAEASPVVLYVDYAVWFVLAMIGVSIGISLVRATAGFSAVVKTQGDDIEHLMQGLDRLAAIFATVYRASILGSVLLATSFVLLVVFA